MKIKIFYFTYISKILKAHEAIYFYKIEKKFISFFQLFLDNDEKIKML